jgi:hypothetical protein
MSEMKSAWERAMEKVDKLGKASPEELKELEYIPSGNRIAARYLKEDTYDLNTGLNEYKDENIRKYVIHGVQEILLRNITLPKDDYGKQSIDRAMAGIRQIKKDQGQLDVIFERINNLIAYYDQARQQAFAQFKTSFETKLKEMGPALQQQQANSGVPLEQQIQMQFQEEWRRTSGQLDSQYEGALEEHRQQIAETE